MPEAEAVIRLWERGEREHPIDRTLSILSTFTSETRDTLVTLPIHRRDALLVTSRVAAFGSRIDGVAGCVACGCKIDVSFELPDLSAIALEDESLIEVGGRAVRVRVPDSGDLAEATRVGDPTAAERLLLARCQPDGYADEVTARAVDLELERLSDASSLELKVACPGCEAKFIVPVARQRTHGRREHRFGRYARRSLRSPLLPAFPRGSPFRCAGQRPFPELDGSRCERRARLQVHRSWL
jgi:hypothetical protein